MKKLTEAQIVARDRKRNLGEELLQAVREIKAGKTGRVFNVEVTDTHVAGLGAGAPRTEWRTRALLNVATISPGVVRKAYDVGWLRAIVAAAGFVAAMILVNLYIYHTVQFLVTFALT
jgi:cytochrome c-type biogenesis protein CcmH/NrfG